LTEGDYGTLTLYATVFSRWLQAKEEVGRELMIEYIVTDNNGIAHKTRRLNPLLKVLEACESRLLALTKTLGLTPIDRDKIKPAAPAGSKEEELIPGTMGWIRAQEAADAKTLKPIAFIRPEDMSADDEETQDVPTDGV
jgi:hypothetical protein